MSQVREALYKAIAENDIDAVVFQDPFQEEARKAKRNLVAASFAALLITVLDLQINGFLGLQTATGAGLGASITKGLAFITVVYFLAAFLLSAFVDYSAWKFRRERLLVKPYLELVSMVEGRFDVTAEQIKNAMSQLNHLSFEKEMQAEIELQKAIQSSRGQLEAIAKAMNSMHEEARPLFRHWEVTVRKTERLTWRLRARFLSLWVLDILIPVALAAGALWKTHNGVVAVAAKVVS